MKHSLLKKKQALEFRRQGMSFSAIREQLGVSKSTLSVWLKDMPLSREQINALRAFSSKRIERFRNTMRMKREARLSDVYAHVVRDIGKITHREIFIAGLFLYWGEGGKTRSYGITFSNTDPNMIRFHLRWLEIPKIPREKIKIRLHLYKDMSVPKETLFWSTHLGLEDRHFIRPYIKQSSMETLTRKGFGHGTCDVIVDNRDISEYVLQGLRYIACKY
jgi:hypothetical protein